MVVSSEFRLNHQHLLMTRLHPCYQLLPNDGVSKSLCTQCWQQLADFEQFCAMVMKKQLGLQQLKMEPFSEDEDADTKAQILCEPEIDVSPAAADNEECNEIDGDASSNSRSSSIRTTSLREMRLPSPIRRRMRLPRAVTAPKTQAVKAKARTKTHKAEADEDEDAEGEGDPESRSSNSREMDSYIALHGRLECCICGGDEQFPNFAEMKRHFRNHHQSLGYVVCCQRRYKKRCLYVDHLHMHNDPNYFRYLTSPGN